MSDNYRRVMEQVIHHNNCYTFSHNYSVRLPADIPTPEDVARYDAWAAKDIEYFENTIAALKEYRSDLQKRYAQLTVMPYTDALTIKRERGYFDKKVFYYVYTERNFEDGTKQLLNNQKFSGADRKAAFELFESMKKQQPGIKTVMDIEKKHWEK